MIVFTSWRAVNSCALLALVLAAPAHTQQQTQRENAPGTGQGTDPALDRRSAVPGDLVIRRTVNRVLIDVVVTDKNGNAVHGLTQNDFSVKEDAKAQRLLSFDTHDNTRPDYVPPRVPPLPVNTFVDVPKEPEQGPLYIILYDMVNTDREDQASSRKPLLTFVDSKPPGTRFAIFLNTDGTKLIQGFTSDRDRLHAALTSEGPGPHLPRQFLYGTVYGQGNAGATLNMFRQLTEYLSGVRGRKNLLWLSGQFPLPLYAQAESVLPQEEIKQTMAAMMRSQISIYPIDVRGVLAFDEAHMTDGGTGDGFDSPEATPVKPAGASSFTGMGTASDFMNEKQIAQVTGGHAYFSSNDIAGLITRAVDQGASFYTLSYSSPDHAEDGKLHRIEVSVAQPGYQLEYRRFYYAASPNEDTGKDTGPLASYRAAARQNDTLYASVQHGAPILHDLLFSAHVRAASAPALATPQQMLQIQDEPAYFRSRQRHAGVNAVPPIKLQRYLVDYLVIDPQLKLVAAQTNKEPTLEFAAAVYDQEGHMLNGMVNDAGTTPPSADQKTAAGKSLFRVEQELFVPMEAAWLRVAVRDKLTDRTGTLEIPLPLQPEPVSQARAETK